MLVLDIAVPLAVVAVGVCLIVLAARTQKPRAAAAPADWLASVLKKKIVVHTRDDQSIEGLLMQRTEDGVILRAARLLATGGTGTAMAGEVFVPRENVAFAQLDE